MTREELIAYDRWLTENKWGSSEIITPEQAADLYLAKHPLPPAEGATDKFRDVLHEVQRLIETEGGATESEMKAIWNSLSCAITESERRSQPPAEGAEKRIRVRNILQDFYRRGEYELEQAEEDIDGKFVYLGSFRLESEAAIAFDIALIKYRKDIINTNFQYANWFCEYLNTLNTK